MIDQCENIEKTYYLALFICEAINYEMPFDIKEMLGKKVAPATKWALIPIAYPNSIKILSKEEVEATIK